MSINTTKLVGYLLLAAGVIVIIVAMFNAYNVFSGKQNPPQVVVLESIQVNVPAQGGSSGAAIELFSGDVTTKLANMLAWYVLMVFMMLGGSKLAGIGVQLLREIKVVLKGEDSSRIVSM
jgi:hypothetical protein